MLRTLWRYGLAVITVSAALIITRFFEPYTDVTPLFYAAVVISAWFGGMGLRTIIESHGGRLWATSNSPRGAVFQFTLPVAQ